MFLFFFFNGPAATEIYTYCNILSRHDALPILKRALRPRERLDAREVIGMDVERALNRRDRHFVEVSADGRQRRRMIGVLARRDAAEIDLAEPGRDRKSTRLNSSH